MKALNTYSYTVLENVNFNGELYYTKKVCVRGLLKADFGNFRIDYLNEF
jgi:hypothetical protein